MAHVEIELNPVDFVTVGTVGPKGRRLFYLQAGRASQLVSLVIEKEQARALAEAVRELLEELNKQQGDPMIHVELNKLNMDLRDPIEPQFRVAQMGLGYDEEKDLIVLVAQELVVMEEDAENLDTEANRPGVVRFWGTRQQMSALANHAADVVKQGRVDPQSNGRLLYYWT